MTHKMMREKSSFPLVLSLKKRRGQCSKWWFTAEECQCAFGAPAQEERVQGSDGFTFDGFRQEEVDQGGIEKILKLRNAGKEGHNGDVFESRKTELSNIGKF